MSFSELKDRLLKSSKLIKLKKQKKVFDDKTGKEILLSFSIKEGKIRLAKNTSEAKTGGCGLKEACASYGDMRESVQESLNLLERKIHSLSLEEQKKLFGDNANKYFKIKPINFSNKRKNYDVKHFLVNKKDFVNTSPAILEDLDEQCSLFENFINEWENDIKAENYSTHSKHVKYLNECADGGYANTAISKLNSNLSSVNSLIGNQSFKLDDDSTMNDYMLARIYILLNGMLDRDSKTSFDPYIKMNIAKKLLGVGGISVPDIMKKVPEEKKLFIKENILNNDSKKEILNNSISPIQNIIFDFINDNMKSIKAILFLHDTPESTRMSKYVDNNLKFMNSGNSLTTYRNILHDMKKLDQHLRKNNNFEFDYDGMTYQPTYDSMPIKEMLETLKFSNINDNIKNNNEEKVLEAKQLFSVVEQMSVSSGAVSFGVATPIKLRRKRKKWNK